MATVPTGLQTCSKVLQIQISGGGGTPWMQPKSNGKLKIASYQLIKFLATDFGSKCIHYSGHCAHRFTNLLYKFLATDFGFNFFHSSGHCSHRIANLCNLQQKCCKYRFQGVGGHLGCNPKLIWLFYGSLFLTSYKCLAADLGFNYFSL